MKPKVRSHWSTKIFSSSQDTTRDLFQGRQKINDIILPYTLTDRVLHTLYVLEVPIHLDS